MHKILLATVAFAGLSAVTTLGAAAAPSAAPLAAGLHATPAQPLATRVDYYDRDRHHWHHRHWEHHHWRYYD
jgi:hypothetical protein